VETNTVAPIQLKSGLWTCYSRRKPPNIETAISGFKVTTETATANDETPSFFFDRNSPCDHVSPFSSLRGLQLHEFLRTPRVDGGRQSHCSPWKLRLKSFDESVQFLPIITSPFVHSWGAHTVSAFGIIRFSFYRKFCKDA
jgi:hypothetical protein